MENQAILCALDPDSLEVIAKYDSVERAATDLLIGVNEILESLTKGCEVNELLWTWQSAKEQKSRGNTKKKKRVIQIDKEGSIVAEFSSVALAVKRTGIFNIDKAARGIIRSAGGFTWKYK